MNVDLYERMWMWAAAGLIVLFLGVIIVTCRARSGPPAQSY